MCRDRTLSYSAMFCVYSSCSMAGGTCTSAVSASPSFWSRTMSRTNSGRSWGEMPLCAACMSNASRLPACSTKSAIWVSTSPGSTVTPFSFAAASSS